MSGIQQCLLRQPGCFVMSPLVVFCTRRRSMRCGARAGARVGRNNRRWVRIGAFSKPTRHAKERFSIVRQKRGRGERARMFCNELIGRGSAQNRIHAGEYTPPGAEAVQIVADPFALFADGTVKWENPLGVEVASGVASPFPRFFVPFRTPGFERLERDLCDWNGVSPSASRKARKDASRSRSGTAQGKRRRIMHTCQFNFKVSTGFTRPWSKLNVALSLGQCCHYIIPGALAQKCRMLAGWITSSHSNGVATAERYGSIRTSEQGTHKDHTNAPHVCLARIIIATCEDFGGEIRVAAHNPGCLD